MKCIEGINVGRTETPVGSRSIGRLRGMFNGLQGIILTLPGGRTIPAPLFVAGRPFPLQT